MQTDIKVVGIGASAGGLEAINDFFDNTPSDTGLAFVIVQHLSPDFKSLMDELLKRHTQMPIEVIKGDTTIQPNHIYLVSSDKNIISQNGMIKQIDRKPSSTLNLPIDEFFYSMGNDWKENAIGVILSGTGSDGSRGIRTIKEAGGLIFVQDPSTAQFNGMPNAAIAIGVADKVLPPYAIAHEIVGVVKKANSQLNQLLNLTNIYEKELFDKILNQVEYASGVNFLEYRTSTLQRRLEKRMYLNHLHDLSEYYNFLLGNKEEVHALYKEFLIGVTRFFRDTEAFEIISNKVFPNLLTSKAPEEAIRIWVTGCSTGEEAYSIAFLLADQIEKRQGTQSFKIFATDIDEEAIKFASLGIYPNNIIADLPEEILQKYFEQQGNHLQVRKFIRESLVFTFHDALKDPPFINIDLISCRNMLIYLTPKTQKNLLNNFQFALNQYAYLFLGPSESITPVKKAFGAIDNRWNIFQKINNVKPITSRSTNIIRKTSTSALFNEENKSDFRPSFGQSIRDDVFARYLASKHAPDTLFVDADFEIIYINGNFNELLPFPSNFASFNLLNILPEEDQLLFRSGFRKAMSTDKAFHYKEVNINRVNKSITLNISFQKFKVKESSKTMVKIEFEPTSENLFHEAQPTATVLRFDEFKSARLEHLEIELVEMKKEKQSLIEQLETTNEELQSSNEELLAANEELQSTNEELQSVNEELYTVNAELQSKVNELIISNNDVNNLLESTQIGTIFLDAHLCIRKFTPALRAQFQLEESDIGRPINNFASSLNDSEFFTEINNSLKESMQIEKEIEDHKGNHYLMRILPYRTDKGNVDGVVITFVDINDLKKAQVSILESIQSYQVILSASHEDVIFTTNIKGVIQTITVQNFMGLPSEEYINHSIFESIHPQFLEPFKRSFEAIAVEKQSFATVEAQVKSAAEQIRWFKFNLAPMVVDQKIRFIVVMSRDITKHKEAERDLKEHSFNLEQEAVEKSKLLEAKNTELKEINRYLDSFVHGAAHDLRSPIVQMKGILNLLPKIDSESQKDRILNQLTLNVSHLDKTLNGLVELIEFQKNTEMLLARINMPEIFNEVLNQLKGENAEVAFTIEQTWKIKYVNYVSAYLKSIFFNLLSNAIKYRAEERPLKIELHVSKKGAFILVKIKDNGIGIDLERYGHFLFQPFKRLTVERSGTGIGLSIIDNAVKQNGGRIEVESKLGKGTTFNVFISPYQQKGIVTINAPMDEEFKAT